MVCPIDIFLLYLTSLFGFVLCQGKIYPEYEQYYEGMDEKQRQAFRYFVKSYRRYNRTIGQVPKDKLAKMDEYLDTSGRGTMMDNILYDNLKVKYDRDKAMQKYSHPDDQEMYMAVRKYTPTLASSEISNWIHNINYRYHNILGINATFEPSIMQKSTSAVGKSTKFSTRFTIFKKGEDPFASDEVSEDSHKLTKIYPKRKIEPMIINDNIEKIIISTKIPRLLQNTSLEAELDTCHPVEAMVREYFKSQSIKYDTKNNGIGFRTCPTGSPLSQEKLLKEFEEMAKVPDFRIEQIFQNYENRSAYNSSYIEEYVRANNISTFWVSDLPMFQNRTWAMEHEMNITIPDLCQESTVSTRTITSTISTRATHETTTEVPTQVAEEQKLVQQTKNLRHEDFLEDNSNDVEEEQRRLENSFKSFLMGNAKKGNESLKEVFDKLYIDEEKLEPDPPVTTDDPVFNSSYYRYIEDKFHEFEKKVTLDKKYAPQQDETTDYEYTYNQERQFHKEVFQNTEELLGPRVVDKLDPSLEKKFTGDVVKEDNEKVNSIETSGKQTFKSFPDEQQSTPKTFEREITRKTSHKTSEQEIETQSKLALLEKELEKKPKPLDQIERQSTSKPLNQEKIQDKESMSESNQPVLKENQASVVPFGGCGTCSNHTSSQHRHRRRHQKHHRSHKRRHHRYRGPRYPPDPYIYNPYHPPPPPYPYPPHYYPPPPPPPNFYHFTSKTPYGDQSESEAAKMTDNQFELYMKLKDIFQPVDNLLHGISPQPRVSLTRPKSPLSAQGGILDSKDLQKYLQTRVDLYPTPPPQVISTPNQARIQTGNFPQEVPEGQKQQQQQQRFYMTTQSLDVYPDYPDAPTVQTNGQCSGPSTSPRMYRSYQRRSRGRHRQCCCHGHNHVRPRRYKGRHPRRKQGAGAHVGERQSENTDITPECRGA